MSEQLLVTLGVQDKGATKQINSLNKELRYLDKEYKTTSKSSKDFENTQAGLQYKIDNLNKKYEATNAKLAAYKKKVEEANEKINKKKQELEKLKNSEEDNTQAISKGEKQLEKYKQQLLDAERGLNLTEKELDNLTTSIKVNESALANFKIEKFKQQMGEVGQKFEQVGQKMNSTGDMLIKLSSPIVAFGGYAVKASMDFESSMSNVQAISGATTKELKELEDKAKEMGSRTSKSAKESADAFSYMALAGWDTKQMLEGIEPILRLSEAGNIDLARASDLVTDSMSAMGIEVTDLTSYLDAVSQTQRKANTTADAMLEAYIACGGTMKNLKVPLNESATYIGILANRGIKASEAGTSLNSVMINLTSGAGQAGEAMKELGLSAFDSQGNFKGMNVVFKELNAKLSTYNEEQRNSYLAMIGGKTQIDTLNALLAGTSEEYSSLNSSIINSNGALNDMAEIMQANTKGNITKMKSELEALGISIGENILPFVNDLIGGLRDVIDWFGSLDSKTQMAIMKFGAFSMVGGTTLKVVGNMTSGVGRLLGSISKLGTATATATTATAAATTATTAATTSVSLLSKATSLLNPTMLAVAGGVAVAGGAIAVMKTENELLNKSLTTSSDELSSFEKAIATFTGKTFESRAELEKAGLIHKEFSETLSPNFQDQIKKSSESVQAFNVVLKEMNLDNLITDAEATALIFRIDEALQGAIGAVESRREETLSKYREAFNADGIIDEEEQKILDTLVIRHDQQREELNQLNEDIKSILEKAKAEERGLYENEIKDIEEKNARIHAIETEAMAQTQEEILYAKNELSNRLKTMTVEEASALAKTRAEERANDVASTKAHYDTLIEGLRTHMVGASEEEQLFYAKKIEDFEAQKAKEIAQHQETYSEFMRIIEENNPLLLEKINFYNGEELTQADKKAQDMLLIMQGQYDDLATITESGTYLMQNKFTGAMEAITVRVDEGTGKIIGAFSDTTNKVGGYSEEFANSAKQMGREFGLSSSDIQRYLREMESGSITSNGKIVDQNGKVVASLQDVKKNSDGTREGFIKLNGEKINIKSNANGTISDMKEIKRSIDNIPNSKTVTIRVNQMSGSSQPQGYGRSTYSLDTYSMDTYSMDTYSMAENDLNSKVRLAANYSVKEYDSEALSTKRFSGGLFSPKSIESLALSNSNKSNEQNRSQSKYRVVEDAKLMGDIIAKAVSMAIQQVTLQGNVKLDNGTLIGTVSNEFALNTKRRR